MDMVQKPETATMKGLTQRQQEGLLESMQAFLRRNTRAYMAISRMHAPVGTLLVWFPITWSLTLCAAQIRAPPSRLLTQLVWYAFGAFWIRGAGCTINDMWDVEFDRQVERTKNRPLVKGDISMRAAFVWFGIQILIAVAPLLVLDRWSLLKGVAVLIMPITYPLMKRYTWWPQLFLAIMMGYVPIMGSATLTGSTDWKVALPLCIGTGCWTMHYDTIYAHQDRTDDELAGVHSTARLFGTYNKPILACIDAIAIVALCVAGVHSKANMLYFAGVAASGLHLLSQLKSVDLDSKKSAGQTFLSNVTLGYMLTVSCILDYWLRIN